MANITVIDLKTQQRNENFDALRGLLILLVLLGHTLLGSYYDNPAKKFIYFFHMPLFLALSGFFLKNSLLSKSPQQILTKYWKRLLIPYIFALIIFTFLDYSLSGTPFRARSALRMLINPFYHLWYIPAITLYLFYTKILFKSQKALLLTLFLSFILTIIYESLGKPWFEKYDFLKALGDLRFYSYYSYFLLGYILANKKSVFRFTEITLFALPAILLIYCFAPTDDLANTAKVLANICLILIIFKICLSLHDTQYKLLTSIGTCTLPIYLWHVLPLMFLKKYIPNGGLDYYLPAAIIHLLLITLIINLNGKSNILNRFLYGTPPQ